MKLSKQISQGRFWTEHYGGVFKSRFKVIWTTQRHKPVLKRDIKKRLEELIRKALEDFCLELGRLNIRPSQVEIIFTTTNPYLSVAQIVSSIKRDSSGILMKEFEDQLRERSKLPTLWNMAYLAVPVSEFSKKIGKNFIEAQKGR